MIFCITLIDFLTHLIKIIPFSTEKRDFFNITEKSVFLSSGLLAKYLVLIFLS